MRSVCRICQERTMRGILHTDGGARGNPGPGAAGIVLTNAEGGLIEEEGEFLGVCTNNEAEYKALTLGMTIALELGVDELDCYLDSELVVKQLKGLYKVKNLGLSALFIKVKQLETKFKRITYTHIKRELNKQADKIVNEI